MKPQLSHSLLAVSVFASLLKAGLGAESPVVHPERFGIRVVDSVTGRGVPLVELKTVNETRFLSDNAGWIAFQEPGLMNREVFWHVSGPGIEREKDGFGFAALRTVTKPGTSIEVKVKTTNIAQRLARLTGQGLYRDSELLGLPHPVPNIIEPGVVGQDSVQMVPFQGKHFWLWGDTSQARYPLGNFHTTCAFTSAASHPESGLVFDYFKDPKDANLLRKMLPSSEPGVVWMFGLMSLKDEQGRERMFSGFSRQKGLVPPDEKGVAEFDAEAGIFNKVADIPKDEKWRAPAGRSVRVKDEAGDYFYFCVPFAHSRVKAEAASIGNPDAYEAYTLDEATQTWQWQKAKPATTQDEERKLLEAKKISSEAARYQLKSNKGQPITLHGASIQWNEWRQRYVLLGLQYGGKDSPSFLGELWYAESKSVLGPWITAVKVATHPQYTFYNPVHHSAFDQEGGKIIYFEGTYTREFSGNPLPTMRYDYNQLMYRLDLSDPRLKAAQLQ